MKAKLLRYIDRYLMICLSLIAAAAFIADKNYGGATWAFIVLSQQLRMNAKANYTETLVHLADEQRESFRELWNAYLTLSRKKTP